VAVGFHVSRISLEVSVTQDREWEPKDLWYRIVCGKTIGNDLLRSGMISWSIILSRWYDFATRIGQQSCSLLPFSWTCPLRRKRCKMQKNQQCRSPAFTSWAFKGRGTFSVPWEDEYTASYCLLQVGVGRLEPGDSHGNRSPGREGRKEDVPPQRYCNPTIFSCWHETWKTTRIATSKRAIKQEQIRLYQTTCHAVSCRKKNHERSGSKEAIRMVDE
jgi:hypothetical protein